MLVLEKRAHFGGNSFSERDEETGIEYHRYGTHLFHTSQPDVWAWINRFTAFNNYRHRVLTRHAGRMYTMPINLMTLNNFFGVDLKPSEAAAFIAERAARDGFTDPQNFEEKAISLVGRELYDAFIRHYTAKQWETDPKLLPAATISRLPVRVELQRLLLQRHLRGPAAGRLSRHLRAYLRRQADRGRLQLRLLRRARHAAPGCAADLHRRDRPVFRLPPGRRSAGARWTSKSSGRPWKTIRVPAW